MNKCKDPECGAIFYWMINPETGKHIPVDEDSMFESEIMDFKKGNKISYDKTRHVSHFKTCKAPNKFSKSKK